MAASVTITAPTASSPSSYFSPDYFTARERFIESMKARSDFQFHDALKLDEKSCDGKDLFIDIAWLGPVDAKKILVHMSGTHGVEGYAGSAGQTFLGDTVDSLPKDTACIMIHGMNPSGFAGNRRATVSTNVDLNRNLSEKRETPELYKKLQYFMSPTEMKTKTWFAEQLAKNIAEYGWPKVKQATADGQYVDPNGMIYGGTEVEEGPKRVFEWMMKQFDGKEDSKDLRFMIVDVHTGLGKMGVDTLLTVEPPSPAIVKFFGDKIKSERQQETTGYDAHGMYCVALQDLITKVTGCTTPILTLGQEIGTLPQQVVLGALWEENMCRTVALESGGKFDPQSPANLQLRAAFNPDSKVFQDGSIKVIGELFSKSMDYLQHAVELNKQ